MLNTKMQKTSAKPNPVLGEKPTSMAQVRTRVGLTTPQKSQTKSLKLNKQPVKLAQVSSQAESESELQEKEDAKIKIFLEMQNGLKELKHTQEKLHQISHPKRKTTNLAQVNNLAKTLGIELNTSPHATNEQIANSMAQKVLAKVRKNVKKPSNTQLLQLNNGNQNHLEEKILLEDKNEINLFTDNYLDEDLEIENS